MNARTFTTSSQSFPPFMSKLEREIRLRWRESFVYKYLCLYLVSVFVWLKGKMFES